jgi:hypothetical protein
MVDCEPRKRAEFPAETTVHRVLPIGRLKDLGRAPTARGQSKMREPLATALNAASILSVYCVPADGISAASIGNGDFGTSPFFGQLTGKPLSTRVYVSGVPRSKHNGASNN